MPTHNMAPVDAEKSRAARFSHIFARLLELQNYVWDSEIEPFHSVSLHRVCPTRQANAHTVLRQLALLRPREDVARPAAFPKRPVLARAVALPRLASSVPHAHPQELRV
jgi:hypothetical protein